MRTVIFIAPFLLEATLKFIKAAASLSGIRLVVITQDSRERIPPGAVFWGVKDATTTESLIEAAQGIKKTWGGIHRIVGILENIQEQIAMVREALGVPGTSVDTARKCRDKSLMKDVLREAGLPCARHKLVQSHEEGMRGGREIGFPLVVKPPDGAGCKATYQVNSTEELNHVLTEVRPGANRKILLEEFITGEEFSFDTITLNGKVVFRNILRYLPGPLDVTRNEWIQWCVVAPRQIDTPEFAGIHEIGPRVVETLGVQNAMTHMEWFRRPDGSPVVSEIGARPPGAQFTSLISYAHSRSFYRIWAQAVIDGAFEGPFERTHAAGAAYLRSPGQGKVVRVSGLDRAQAHVGGLVVEVSLPTIGRPKSTHYEGDGYVIVRHLDTRVVMEALKVIIETVRVEYQ
jgi:formate-dependent phosphoribosylglycinamide formyltransferase (GAR transformylase)